MIFLSTSTIIESYCYVTRFEYAIFECINSFDIMYNMLQTFFQLSVHVSKLPKHMEANSKK